MGEVSILNNVDLNEKLSREGYKALIPDLEIRFGSLQRRAIEAGLPVMVAFEGWEAAGKGTLINRLIRTLDRRHFKVFSIKDPTPDERLRPFLWRFWMRVPPAGKMSILDRSWYRRVLNDRVNKTVKKREWRAVYDDIEWFEQQLTSGGYLLIKLFLHISQEEQHERFIKLDSNPSTAWRITKRDWIHHKNYAAYRRFAEEMIERSNTPNAPWHVIAAQNRRHATVTMFETVCKLLEEALEARRSTVVTPTVNGRAVESTQESVLDSVDLTKTISREDYSKRLDRYQEQIRDLEHEIYVKRIPVVIVYEGWDASGKGGNIKRLTQSMDPRGYEVIPIGPPNVIEKRYHYLWRFWRAIPKDGHVSIFDRSWYGRVLVERVEGFCTQAEWERAYEEINQFEMQLIDAGTVLVKFWLHIDSDEQLRRFKEREATPHKNWKITEDDWHNRNQWGEYLIALRDMLDRTSPPNAPWTIVESNSKHYARLKTLKTVIKAIQDKI